MSWTIKAFNELTTMELFTIYQERIKVFVVEQNCPYQDIDPLDLTSLHVFKLDKNGHILAYGRVLPVGSPYQLGRIIVAKEQRGTGLGKELVSTILAVIGAREPEHAVKIQAQAYLEKFYSHFGFVAVSDRYLEDDIPHIDMLLDKKA